MAEKQEKLGDKAKVTSTILKAYLAWALNRWGDPVERLKTHLDADTLALVSQPPTQHRRILFRQLIAVARAIAAAEGGAAEATYRELGRQSATVNMAGAHKAFNPEVPHQFLELMVHLHGTFQNFGRSTYARTGESSGQVRLEGYTEYSPVYCETARGYYEEALRMMKAPGPITVEETSCQCAGQPACVYEMRW